MTPIRGRTFLSELDGTNVDKEVLTLFPVFGSASLFSDDPFGRKFRSQCPTQDRGSSLGETRRPRSTSTTIV